MNQYMDRIFEGAAKGDLETVSYILRGIPDVNVRNDHGWTALMFAARNGHANVVKALMDKGADKTIINSSGQSALDLAKFWNHKQVVATLDCIDASPEDTSFNFKQGIKPNYFSASVLDRAAHRRKDPEWLQKTMVKASTKYIMYSKLQPLGRPKAHQTVPGERLQYKLCIVGFDDIKAHLDSGLTTVFLGVESFDQNESDAAWFAVDVTTLSEESVKELHPEAEQLNPFPDMMFMNGQEAAICGQGRSILAWHERYSFCPTCGSSTRIEEAGYKRKCLNTECRSLRGVHNTSYPRLDPTVIMAVISPDGQKILLGREKRFPKGMFTCLAGFIEPGESIEDACRREVMEESGVKVETVKYHSCQPWPMPASLMIGCLAQAVSMEIKVDGDELEEARWFSRLDAIALLNHKHPKGCFCPPEQAIAHQLIKAFVNISANL